MNVDNNKYTLGTGSGNNSKPGNGGGSNHMRGNGCGKKVEVCLLTSLNLLNLHDPKTLVDSSTNTLCL